MLDPSSPLPLYHQLADELFTRIRDGAYPPGEKIPSEHELARRYGLGRPTVRQATDTLIRSGVLERRRGSGTYVRSVPAQVDLFSLAGTLVSFEESGLALESALIRKPRVEVVDEAGHPHARCSAVRIVRLSSVRRAPVLLEEIDFLADWFPGLSRLSLGKQSLSEVVRKRYGMRLESADQSFRVTELDPERAERFALAPGDPLLEVRRTLNFTGRPAAVFARMFCRTDRFVFSQRIGRASHV